ncbi:MAG: Hsp33 family molecular chaperone HslO [Chloroflexi bacterium]|jgi:molecular chaperone Hsp33|nr:Hsp33 family molecular chaperone HslO [Chloroflexota bacterium]MBK7178044.1 Hsp33 family molecular chaperone HslO [Chloroflexota bacterium]MBK7919485.1 Hsp33 family molecular chaperone HslO [Chloroflexota bacterium]
MEDYLIRVIAKEAGVRGLACVTTNMANEAARRHEAAPTAAAALARGLTGGALMGATLKIGQRIAIKLEGDGPLGKMLVESDAYGRIRGYVGNPQLDLPPVNGRQNVSGAVGDIGFLTVVRDLRLKEPVESVVPLQTGTVDADLTFFLNQSEQVLSAVEIGALMDEAGQLTAVAGFLFQALPPYEEKTIQDMIARMTDLPPIEKLLQEGDQPEDLLALIFTGMAYEVLEKRPLLYHCNCSQERSEQALINLGRAGLEELLATEGEAVVNCHFCGNTYLFAADDLEMILAGMP